MTTALHGIRVLDFSRVLAGPYCTMTLGDLGAEIIKIENPVVGDDSRTFQVSESLGISTYFLAVNRNKKSVAIDLRTDAGRDLVLAMLPKADVLVENYSTGVMERLGLGYETLSERHPSLIYCSISGYGRTGPLKDRPGYDPISQGESGFMSLTGEPDGDPMRTGVSVIDIIAGMFAAQAILAALLARTHSGAGQRIDVPLFDTAINMTLHGATAFLVDGKVLGRPGNGNLLAGPAGLYHAADGPMMLAMTTDRVFRRFCAEVLERPEMADDARYIDNPTRVRHRQELERELNEIFAGKPREFWIERMRKASIPAGVINDVGQAITSAEMIARDLVTQAPHALAGTVPGIASPMHLSATPVCEPVGAPTLGQHTDEVLRDMAGCDAARIAELRAAGIVNG